MWLVTFWNLLSKVKVVPHTPAAHNLSAGDGNELVR
jgi:hypothetical protein